MSSVDKNLNNILEIQPQQLPAEPSENQIVKIEPDVGGDFDYSRANYYNLLEKGNEALDGLLEVAKESQQPRAYEVASNMLKNLSDMTDKLMMLQKQKKDLEGNKEPTSIQVDKAVFVGSTTDLLKKIKNKNS